MLSSCYITVHIVAHQSAIYKLFTIYVRTMQKTHVTVYNTDV